MRLIHTIGRRIEDTWHIEASTEDQCEALQIAEEHGLSIRSVWVPSVSPAEGYRFETENLGKVSFRDLFLEGELGVRRPRGFLTVNDDDASSDFERAFQAVMPAGCSFFAIHAVTRDHSEAQAIAQVRSGA